MAQNELLARIAAETGLLVNNPREQHVLSGIFNRYRPDGDGLDRILSGDGVEGEVRNRIRRVFEATASGWNPSDLYFVVRRFRPIDLTFAANVSADYFSGIKQLAEFVGDQEVAETVSSLRIDQHSGSIVAEDSDTPVIVYEFLTDFLAKFQPARQELFVLKEALYSMANDYFLMAYMLWPAIVDATGGQLAQSVMDSYLDMWRYGIKLQYWAGGVVSVGLSA